MELMVGTEMCSCLVGEAQTSTSYREHKMIIIRKRPEVMAWREEDSCPNYMKKDKYAGYVRASSFQQQKDISWQS